MSIAPETIAVAAALGAIERLSAAVDDHLEHGQAGQAARDVTEMNLRAAMRDAQEVARQVSPHGVESRDTASSTKPSIITGVKRRAASATSHSGSPDWETAGNR